jgi:hypothetical protein
MGYFYNPKKKNTAAHIWTGTDTYCRMFSTGGLNPGIKKVFDTTMGKRVCQMCQTNYDKYQNKAS